VKIEMKIFEGKSKEERNKLIAALVLGTLAVIAVGYNLLGLFSSSPAPVTQVSSAPTPTPSTSGSVPPSSRIDAETNFEYETTEVRYSPGMYAAPAPSRNIFAVYEPTPVPVSTPRPVPTPMPTPPPPQTIVALSPSTTYSGGKGFRIEVSGSNFNADTKIYFNQTSLQTTFINSQRLAADVTASMVASEGFRSVQVKTPDGKLYSNLANFNVLAPPKPTFTYLGPVTRTKSNNATAYIQEQGAANPIAKRLSDVVGGRFKIVNITPSQVVVEDTGLGFRHVVAIAPQSSLPAPPASFRPMVPGIIVDSGIQPGIQPGTPPANPAASPRPGFQNPRRPPPPQTDQDTDPSDDTDDTDG
jgi:hypothetical protein